MRSASRSRENLAVHVNGSRHSSHEDLSHLSRVRLDSSEDHSHCSDDESVGGAKGGRTEPERMPLMPRGSLGGGEAAVGMRTATGAAAVGVAAAAAAATSPPPIAAWVGSGQCDGLGTPIEVVDSRLSSV